MFYVKTCMCKFMLHVHVHPSDISSVTEIAIYLKQVECVINIVTVRPPTLNMHIRVRGGFKGDAPRPPLPSPYPPKIGKNKIF